MRTQVSGKVNSLKAAVCMQSAALGGKMTLTSWRWPSGFVRLRGRAAGDERSLGRAFRLRTYVRR